LNEGTITTRELDRRRGVRTTLPTLVPLVMCFDCRLIRTGRMNHETQNKMIERSEARNQIFNCVNLEGKSMVIISKIEKSKKLSDLTKNYCFYEKNKILNDNYILTKRIHYIQYKCSFKGGLNKTIIIINDSHIPMNIPNSTLGEEIMRIIGAWINTDGNLIDLYGMHDTFSRKYLIDRNDVIWNGRNDYKYIKTKITR
jgi:hypothetical protein